MKQSICIVLVIILTTVIARIQHGTIQGSGASFLAPIMNEWMNEFKFVRPQISLAYHTTGSERGIEAVRTGKAPFALSEILPPQMKTKSEEEIIVHPFAVGAVIPIFNLPEYDIEKGPFVPTDDLSDPFIANLTLEPEVLAKIFLGEIHYWNDSLIKQDNQNVPLPYRQIHVVSRVKSSGTTRMFTSGLSKISKQWKDTYGTNKTWPKELTANNRSSQVHNSQAMFSEVYSTKYSIGYVGAGFVVDEAIGEIHLKGQKEENIFSKYDLTQDYESGSGWPLIGVSYLLLPADTKVAGQSCEKAREMLAFLNWALTDSKARNSMQRAGYAPLPEEMNQELIDLIATIKCDGKLAFPAVRADTHESPVHLALLILSLTTCLAVGVLLYFYVSVNAKPKGIKGTTGAKSGPNRHTLVRVYSTTFVIGSLFNYGAAIPLYLIPTNDSICISRIWCSVLGLSLLINVLFARLGALQWAHSRHKNNILSAVRPTWRVFFGHVMISLLLQITLLSVWTGMDPYTHHRKVVDPILNVYETRCFSERNGLWFGLEAGYFAVCLLWGVKVLYSSWQISREIKEAKWVLLAFFNILINIVFMSTLYGVVESVGEGIKEDLEVFVIFFFTYTSGTAVLLSVLLPAVYVTVKEQVGKLGLSRSKNSNDTRKEMKTIKGKDDAGLNSVSAGVNPVNRSLKAKGSDEGKSPR